MPQNVVRPPSPPSPRPVSTAQSARPPTRPPPPPAEALQSPNLPPPGTERSARLPVPAKGIADSAALAAPLAPAAEPPLEPSEQQIRVIRAEPAAIWRRAGAWLIDGAILSAATVAYAAYARAHMSHLPPATQTTGLDWLANRIDSYSGLWIHAAVFAAAAGLLFTVLFHHFGGRTPGKWALRICLVDGSGCRPTFAVCVWRGLVSVVAAGALGLGYFLALFVRRHRGLQDLLSKTYVVRILPS